MAAQGLTSLFPISNLAIMGLLEVLPKILECRPAEKPIAVVDLVDDEAWFQNDDVGNHRIMVGICVFSDVEIFLNDSSRIRQKWPVGADA